MKRIISLLLALVMACSLLPAVQAAPNSGTGASAGANPLYPHEQAPEPSLEPMAQPRPMEPNATYKTPANAAVDYREAMEDRKATITLYVKYDRPGFDPYADMIPELMELAFTETGVPTEGDSLRWVWGTYYAGWSWYEEGSAYLMEITIDMTYYTTISQERTLAAKMDQVLDSFNFTADTSDYRKVKTIYDYITENVVYDYEHVNDESYKPQFTAYAALCQGVAVCQGYAVLFYQMLLEEGICARVVTGWGGGPHAWNIVELEGKFYNCDSTWDAGMDSYSWFLCCPSTFPDHYREDYYETSDFHSRYPMGKTDYVPPHEHTYSAWTVTEPTCTADGSKVRTCSGCGNTERIVLPALGHSYNATVTAPTCEDPGCTTHTCARCGDSYTDSHVEALGHDWDEGYVTFDPTESSPGLLVYTCLRCAATDEVTLQPHVHGYTEETVIDPTCEDAGYTKHTCPGCGHFYTDSYVDALGHVWDLDRCTRCDGERPSPFTDTEPDTFYYLPVLWALDNGITTGTGADTFSPNNPCLRAQVVTFLYRAFTDSEGSTGYPGYNQNPFTDVTPSDFYYAPVLWALENGITTGIDSTHFGPYQTCNRAQVVTFLWRAAGCPEPNYTENPFTDVTEYDFYYKAVLWAVEHGITNGISADSFGPGSPCNRAQIVTFLYRAFGT